MIEISKNLRLEIYKLIKSQKSPFGDLNGDEVYLPFLSKIWDLQLMPSEDSRYKDAYGDIYQHTVNNDDWELDYLFLERLNLLEDNDKYVRFLEVMLSPEIREDEDDIMNYYFLINPYLEKENLSFVIAEYSNDDIPIYEIQLDKNNTNIPSDIKKNTIPFFVERNPHGFPHISTSHNKPLIAPSFILVHNNQWNDFGISSSFNLFYYSHISSCISIGSLKIIEKEETNTSRVIENRFDNLTENFCSLGSEEFYISLKKIFNKDFLSVLFALRDVAFFPDNHDRFEKESFFINSILRTNSSERILREIKYKIYGYDLSNLYNFKYKFKPKYSDTSVDVDFDFNSNPHMCNRIYSIIGKNGAGKTQFMTSLPIDIYKKNNELFSPKSPLFSKVIAVSYSAYDSFEIPNKTASFNYVYCGLRDLKGNTLSEKGQVLRFHHSWKRIKRFERIGQWRKILLSFIEKDLIDLFIINSIDGDDENAYNVDLKGFGKVRKMLSSGQSIVLYIITEIVSHIRYDSIILYDEPETHLHPNAISELINTIYELVNEFESYCIIATHSPLIIREIMSKNVYVIEKHDNIPSVRKPGLETFGENLTVLTEEVFGNKSIPKYYKKVIRKMVTDGMSFEEILSSIESDKVCLSLNARLFIQSIINEKS